MEKSKIKYPITLEALIKLALPGKSKKFRKEYHWWYQGQILWHNTRRKPADEEIKQFIAGDMFRYDEDATGRATRQVHDWLPIFLKETRPKIALPVSESDFPMSFKQCLRRVVGRRSYGENLPIFKAYWHHALKSIAESNGYPSYERTDEYIGNLVLSQIEWMKKDGVPYFMFKKFTDDIPAWRKKYRASPQNSLNAKSRWTKRKEIRKKILTLLLQHPNAISHP